jgi:hypothetical protein
MYNELVKIIRNNRALYYMYSLILYAFNRFKYSKINTIELPPDFKVISAPFFKNTFFGYYDVSPFCPKNNQLLLVHANNIKPYKTCSSYNYTSIGYVDLINDQFIKVDETQAWNWQQGARLQWIDQDSFVYNFYENKSKQLVAKSYNIAKQQYSIYDFPVQAAFADKYYLTLDYADLSKYSEYGYTGLNIKNKIEGILLCFFNSRKPEQLLSKKELRLNFKHLQFTKDHINHILISPLGDRFIFTYRFYIKNQRFDNLFMYNFNSKELSNLIKLQVLSHCSWRNNNELIIWGNINNQKGYYQFQIGKGTPELLVNEPNDGHPTYINNSEFISDTYPDKEWNQKLYIYNIINQQKRTLLTVPHPVIIPKSGTRCDLHPSISIDKKQVQIDSRHLNKRVIIIGEI